MKWQEKLKQSFTSFEKLLTYLEIDQSPFPVDFPVLVPIRLAEKMEKGNPQDPIFLQFVPTPPVGSNPIFTKHPVQDESFGCSKKLIKKYEARSLLLATSACAMHCRYCFRQNYPYEKENPSFEKELSLLKNDPSTVELILSGGDPLSLSNRRLSELFSELEEISHLKLVRFHTRFPIGIPERIDEEFLHILEKTPLQVIFIVHINHPREVDNDVRDALKKIASLGIPILNQSVLLQGVNDSFEVLHSLSLVLISSGIIPYYLHQLDEVTGAERFLVSIEKGSALIDQLRESLPGYAVPKYVKEIPFKKSKTPLLHTI